MEDPALPPVVANGWYALVDHVGERENLVAEALGARWGVAVQEGNVRAFLLCDCASSWCGCESHGGAAKGCDRCGRVPTERLVDVVLGVVFVWWHADDATPTYRVSEAISDLANDVVGSPMVSHGTLVHHVRGLLQDIPENGCDIAHFPALHEDGSIAFGAVGALLKLRIKFTAKWAVDEEDSHVAHATVRNHLQVWGSDLAFTDQVVKARQIGPSVALEDSPRGVLGHRILLFQTVTPLGPFLHKEVTRVYSAPGILARAGCNLFIQGFRKNLEADIMVQNAKVYRRQPLLVRGDGPIRQFRKWYSQFYSESSKQRAIQIWDGVN